MEKKLEKWGVHFFSIPSFSVLGHLKTLLPNKKALPKSYHIYTVLFIAVILSIDSKMYRYFDSEKFYTFIIFVQIIHLQNVLFMLHFARFCVFLIPGRIDCATAG